MALNSEANRTYKTDGTGRFARLPHSNYSIKKPAAHLCYVIAQDATSVSCLLNIFLTECEAHQTEYLSGENEKFTTLRGSGLMKMKI